MNKPITVAREELANTILNAINSSGLPAFAILDLLAQIESETRQVANRQFAEDSRKWNQYLESQKEKETEEEKGQV